MRWAGLILLMLVQPVFGFEYVLIYDHECRSGGPAKTLPFNCKKSTGKAVLRQRADGKWVGVNGNKEVLLSVIKNDEYILVLNDPVPYSGMSTIYLMKPTGRFYWSEFAYSEILKADEGHVRFGRLELKKR